MSDSNPHMPMVGIGVMIFRDNRILLGRRKGAHGSGEFAFPGGHMEHGESFESCARRETLEECGISITDIRFQLLANVLDYLPRHYVHINLSARWASGEAQVLEADKCESWNWYSFDGLPTPLFGPTATAIRNHLAGIMYQDSPT